MSPITLSQSVDQFAGRFLQLTEEELGREWRWREHIEDMRIAVMGPYQELRELAITLKQGRIAAGQPPSAAQYALASYHVAYCDLEALLLGVGDGDLDQSPAEGEWSLRAILRHIIDADRMFFTLIHQAAESYRAKQSPSRVNRTAMRELIGTRKAFRQLMEGGDLATIQNYYTAFHTRVLAELSGLSDDELEARSIFWESEAQTIRYRLHRFDAHLRQHTVQAQKTLGTIGREPSEAKRLLRLLYNALGEVEGALIGAGDWGADQCSGVAQSIQERTAELDAIQEKASS